VVKTSAPEDLLGDLRGQAKSAGSVFRVDDGQVHGMGLAQMANVLAHDLAPRAAEDVADE
jgi:hypothetical protein